jgi:hypothetical protein
MDLGRSRRRPLSAHEPFFTPHVFAIKAVEKESPQHVTRSQRPGRPIISSADGTEANHWIDPKML